MNSANSFAPRLGPEAGQRALVARGQDPPRRLALGAVLAYQDADPRPVEPGVASPEHEAGHRAAGLRLLRRLLHVETAGLGEVEHDAGAVVELPHQVLGPAPDRDEPVALEGVGRGVVGLERREAEQVGPTQRQAGQECVEALGQRLHLGQFGHATMYA